MLKQIKWGGLSYYAQYFEMGRVEWLRNIGISYKWMEENGIMLQ
jgi:acyl-CoA thioesterase FadM